MEREVGGGIGMGNTCKPLAVLFQCMTKSTTKKKKKKCCIFPVLVTNILSIPVEYFREVSLFHAPAGPPVFHCSYPPGTVPGAFQMFINSHSTILSIGSVWLPQVDICGDLKV